MKSLQGKKLSLASGPFGILGSTIWIATASLALFLPVIIRQKGVPSRGIGLLWTIPPLVSLFTNSASGGIADAFKIHKAVFLLGLIFLTSGMCAIYFVPAVSDKRALLDTFDQRENERSEAVEVYLNLTKIKNEETDSAVTQVLDDIPLSTALKMSSFWVVFLCLLVEHIGMGITNIFADAICFKILGTEHEQYGRQRMWGTVGMGIFSIIIGALNDWYSAGKREQDFLPGFVICVILMGMDIILVSRMTIPAPEKVNFDWQALTLLLKSPKTILFLITAGMYGFSCGINWTFRLILIEDVALEYDPNFPVMKLLLGSLMTVETFGGELPFLFFSGCIIKQFGHVSVFVICLLSISLRFFLYFLLTNPWLCLFVELLNGPAYGLLHADTVAYGTYIAPVGALATVHAIIRASFSAGQCLGGLIGGLLYDSRGGSQTFLISSLIFLGFTVIYIIAQLILQNTHRTSTVIGRSYRSSTSDSTDQVKMETRFAKDCSSNISASPEC